MYVGLYSISHTSIFIILIYLKYFVIVATYLIFVLLLLIFECLSLVCIKLFNLYCLRLKLSIKTFRLYRQYCFIYSVINNSFTK